MIWLLVGIGGAIGSMARHGLNHLVHQRLLTSMFPFGTFFVNVIGSVTIGVIAGALAPGRLQASYEMRTFLIVGVLGGFTTFSSFSLDTLTLIRSGHTLQAVGNVAGQVALSLIGVWLGFRLASR